MHRCTEVTTPVTWQLGLLFHPISNTTVAAEVLVFIYFSREFVHWYVVLVSSSCVSVRAQVTRVYDRVSGGEHVCGNVLATVTSAGQLWWVLLPIYVKRDVVAAHRDF